MAKLKSYYWMIAGAVLSFFSKLLGTGDSNYFTLFFYIGIVFFLIGIVKALFETSDEKEEVEAKKVIYCDECGTKNHSVSNYCHICGASLPDLKGRSAKP